MKENFDQELERLASQIQSTQPSEAQIQQAAARVWNRLADGSTADAVQAAEIDQINGCEDYQKLIPAYLADQLPQARKLLLEDHTRECVPCRRALNMARDGETAPTLPRAPRRAGSSKIQRWAIAAMLILSVGALGYFAWDQMFFGSGQGATVKTVDGQLFRVASTSHLPLVNGDAIERGETVRTGREGGSIIELNDGSRVELRERSEIAIRESRGGTTIELARGNVIVQAAEQRQRHLYVATDDCLVSVTGTIFSVNHGTKGSRVAVIEGEVRVQHGGDETVLQPGQQVATQANLNVVPLQDEIAWSRDVDQYLQMLSELNVLRRELDALPRPDLRYSSRLLDLMPEDTHFYGAVPNLGETVNSAHQVLTQRLTESPMLSEWWQLNGQNLEPAIEDVVNRVSRFSEFLGDEIAFGGGLSVSDFNGPLVLSEITDGEGLRQFIEEQLDDASWLSDDEPIIFVEDPLRSIADAKALFIWLGDEVMAASPKPALINAVAQVILEGQSNAFVGSDFHRQLSELYNEGADILAGADLEAVIASTVRDGDDEQDGPSLAELERLGVLDVHHLMVEHKSGDLTENRAALTFKGERRGIASWIAAPAPMGSLDFISADAKVVGAVVFKDPVRMLEDLEQILGERANLDEHLAEARERLGIDLREDIAAVLGGEIAFAFDGPLLPEPAWKAILEVYDSSRFQWALEQALDHLNTHLAEQGEASIEIQQQDVGGRTYYSVAIQGYDIHYTFVEGYLVAAPNRALLDRAIRFRDSGYSIVQAPRFNSMLPNDGRNNYSALFYQDVGSLMQAMVERIGEGQLTDEQQQVLDELRSENTSTLGYAYAEDERIIVAATTEGGILGNLLMQIAGLKDVAGLNALFPQGF